MKIHQAALIGLTSAMLSLPELVKAAGSKGGAGKGKSSKAGGGKGGPGKGKSSKGGKGTGDDRCNDSGGKGKGGRRVKDEKAMTPEAKCAVFQSFVNVASSTTLNNSNSTRRAPEGAGRELFFPADPGGFCESFDPVDPFVCPSKSRTRKICAEPRPALNPAVKKRYCEPLFEDICDDEERDECVRRCIQYVSQDEGDCCDFECDQECATTGESF